MNSVRRDRVAPRLVRLGAGLVVGGTLVAAPEAPAYRLMHDREGAILGGESGAFRWPDDAWPLRYRLLENDLLPVDVFADHDAWREFLGAAFQQWNDIPTAEVDIRLEGEPVMQRDGSDGDGINTIGFSADLEATGGRINGRVSWVLEGDRLVGCDVMVNPAYPATLPEEDRLEKLTGLVLHEIGHCLPLLHSDPMPMTIHVELPGVNLTGFSPDPAMSYGNFRESLTVDDMVAASLLYPAPEFRDSTGGLTGTVRFDDGAPGSVHLRTGGRDREYAPPRRSWNVHRRRWPFPYRRATARPGHALVPPERHSRRPPVRRRICVLVPGSVVVRGSHRG